MVHMFGIYTFKALYKHELIQNIIWGKLVNIIPNLQKGKQIQRG